MSEQENDKGLLQEARREILSLRRKCEVLEARVETMDMCAMFLRTEVRYPNQGYAEDVAWKLERRIADFDGVKETPNE